MTDSPLESYKLIIMDVSDIKIEYHRETEPPRLGGYSDIPGAKLFEIWMEGYAATGESSGAQMIGRSWGINFDDAIVKFCAANPKSGIEWNDRGRYTSAEAYENRNSHWNIWACNLYDNEADARKFFG